MKGIDSYFSSKTAKNTKNTENEASPVKSSKKKKALRAVISSSDDEPEISVTTDYKKNKMSESKNSEPKKMAVKTTTGDYFSSFGSMKKKSKTDKNKENKKPEEIVSEIVEKPKKRVLEIIDMQNELETAPTPKKHKKSKSPKVLKSDEIITLDSQPSQTTTNSTPNPVKPSSKSMKVTTSSSKTPTKTPKKLTDKTKTPKSSETKKPVKPDLTEEEKEEAKKLRAKNFRAFQNREAPKDIGKVEIPHGPMDALEGKMFCLSGVLEFITKEDFQDFIGRHGGVWKTSVTKKTDFLVKGRDAGQTKINKAQNGFTKVITGEDVVEMVKNKIVDDDDMDVDALEKSMAEGFDSDENSKNDEKSQKPSQVDEKSQQSTKKSSKLVEKTSTLKTSKKLPESVKTPMIRQGLKVLEIKDDTPGTTPLKSLPSNKGPADDTMMVDKYKPTEMKSIIGQTGAQSVANKLHAWLKDWRKNMKKMDFKGQTAKPQGANSFALKAALLSGPPGIGKTTTANLVAKSLGFAVVEYNASSVRSQKLLKAKLGVEISNSKIGVNSDDKCESKSVIIMDEVDGMSGNSDRGGVAVLIEFIKKSRLPIICICNDRGHAKVRSLSNHCFDLRVQWGVNSCFSRMIECDSTRFLVDLQNICLECFNH